MKQNHLTGQVYIPSINSGYFFTKEEQDVQDKISSLYHKKKENKNLIKQHRDKKDRDIRKDLRTENREIDELVKLLRTEQHDLISKNQNVRSLSRPIQPKHYVGMLESTLSRTLGLMTDEESNDLIIVEVFQSHDEILRQLLEKGFTYNGEEYVYFSSSSGQIKTRKAVFMKKSQWEKHQRALMGGLNIEEINNKGGINPNKLLSYMMLANSATTRWEVNLRKVVVVDDMETVVKGVVDFVDDETFGVSRGEKEITIKQTDGIGFCLPSVSDKAFMIRLPWMKGLIVPVPFDKYNGKTTKVTDCWNKTWDIVDDGIKIILHKSQFKLADYYESWEEYIDKFEKYHCEMAIGNVEDDHFKDATLTYQMLQTLTDVTDDELKEISQITVNKISKIGRDKEVILDLLGVVEENKHKNYLQQVIELYPAIINDKYTRKVISDTKKSYIKNARAGKIDLPNAKYTYVVPDVVAWMDWLFNKQVNPKGILGKEQVSCKLYEDGKRLDILRSPHLYREHGLRDNVVNEETSKWFITNCIYVSIDSLLSKLLQYDSDGDKLLIVDNNTFVQIAERNMEGIVPLVYNMRSSDKKNINSEELYLLSPKIGFESYPLILLS
ncbi:RNA dependent RNA polymerase [Brevibacillus agri]|uniref:RNA dependent RNA polymerase n=1 Tax=Brevibacillus agri TaxID=51101 RepID=UPI003D712A45